MTDTDTTQPPPAVAAAPVAEVPAVADPADELAQRMVENRQLSAMDADALGRLVNGSKPRTEEEVLQ